MFIHEINRLILRSNIPLYMWFLKIEIQGYLVPSFLLDKLGN